MAGTPTFCGRITRVGFILINIVLCVVGVLVIGAGGYDMYIGHMEGSPTVIMVIGYVFIIAGLLLMILVMVGVLGAICSSKIVLCQYNFFVGVVIFLAIIGSILCFAFREKIPNILKDDFENDIKNYHDENDLDFKPSINAHIDFFQSKIQCCGWVNAQSDWEQAPFFTTNNRFPESCLCTPPGPCMRSPSTDQSIWNTICKDSVVSLAKGILAVIGTVGTFTALILIVPVILAIILILTIRNDYKSLTV